MVHITFNPLQISLRDLFEVFFTIHDPTTPNRQGADVGPQYRSTILYHTLKQKQLAEQVITELNEEKVWAAPIVTEIQPLDAFYRAEAEHEQYYQRNPDQAYCRMVIAPKIAKLRKQHMEKLSNKQMA